MSMKEAFDIYFEKMKKSCLEKYGGNPNKPIIRKFQDVGFYDLETMEKHKMAGNKGYADWKPILQNMPVSFKPIESKLGITLHPQIKSFLSTYWFLALRGSLNGADIGIDAITPDIDFLQYIGYRFNNEDFNYLENNDFIMIGSSVQIGPIDSYLLEVNNNTGEVFAIEVMDKKSVKLADSIEELLINMEGY